MSNPLTYGLPLGLRIYDSEDKQVRFKYECSKGINHQEYQYADYCGVPPFQIVRTPAPCTDFKIYIICADTETEYDMDTYCPDMVAALQLVTIGGYDYISYLGPDSHTCCNLTIFDTRALVNIRVECGSQMWYSEFFYIDPDGVDTGETNYRLWTFGGIRTPGPLDLRTWK